MCSAVHRQRHAGSDFADYVQDEDNQWFGFSQRARILFYDKDAVENPPMTYQDLANPEFEGMVCIRSSSNVYTQTIVSALIEHLGYDATLDWAKAVVGNFARDPQGGDTDQLRGIVSASAKWRCPTPTTSHAPSQDVSGLSPDIEGGLVFPNQNSIGAHMNLSGGGGSTCPNKENAIKFLEYLAFRRRSSTSPVTTNTRRPRRGDRPSVASLGCSRMIWTQLQSPQRARRRSC